MSAIAELPSSRASVDALPVDSDCVTEELKIKAKKELFEDENARIQGLKSLRGLLKEEKDLRYQDDDLFLLAFLRARKFDVTRAFSLIKGFYSGLGKRGHLYYIGFDYFLKMLEENSCGVLPYRDSENSVIFYFRFSSWNPGNITAEEHMVCATLCYLQALRSASTQIAGFQIISDYKGFSMKHLIRLTPSIMWFFAAIMQETIPMRVRAIHVVHENPLFSYVLSILKRFLSKKMYERVHIHGSDMESLHKFIPPSILPEDLGGEQPPFNNSEWRNKMEASSDYINHVLSFGYEKYLSKHWKPVKHNKK